MTKEKKPYIIDSEGNRRDPNRAGSPRLCSAHSKRTGKLCCNIARPNGKCRVHGGNSTGPKTTEGKKKVADLMRKKAFKTGEHVPIWFDTLREDEQELIESMSREAEALLDQQIMLAMVRERRMLENIKDLNEKLDAGEAEVTVQESWKRQLVRDMDGEEIIHEREDGTQEKQTELVMSSKQVIKADIRNQIQAAEDALTRVQVQLSKLIEMKHKLSEGKVDRQDGSLQALTSILAKARGLRIENTTRVEMENQQNVEEN